jgi:transposase
MIGSTRTLRVWAYAAPADLRKGFDGLAGLVTAQLRQDPLGGDCFLFVNRLRTRAKVLLWDGTGLCVYHKRLEQGRFAALWPGAGEARGPARTLTLSELTLFLEGCTLLMRTALAPTAVTPRTWTPAVPST